MPCDYALSVIIPVKNESHEDLSRARQHLKSPITQIVIVETTEGSDDSFGRAKTMNHGASLAQGEWFYFLHADCLSTLDVSVTSSLDSRKAYTFPKIYSGSHPWLQFQAAALNALQRSFKMYQFIPNLI